MAVISERAPAKVNLTLEVLGRRPDGYHELVSLVAFASAGDELTLEPGQPPGVTIGGPFAAALCGPNILDRALALISERAPQLTLGRVRLEKALPVSAGVGGGSADAAALLRAVRRANASSSSDVSWHDLARVLGADVPVCLESRAVWMSGVGETLTPVAGELPVLAAVLVNPLAPVPADKTARVFRALGAAPVVPDAASLALPPISGRPALIDLMRTRGNQLSEAALSVVPEMADVVAELRASPSLEVTAVSGAGPTCFGIFPDQAAAEAARRAIAAAHPDWWVVATELGSATTSPWRGEDGPPQA